MTLSTTISYSYMILGPCHKLYTIYQNKDTVSKLYCFENDKREPVDYNIIFLYDTRTMSQIYTIYQNKDTVSKLYCFENDKREPVDYNIIFLYDTRTMSQIIYNISK